MIGCRGGALLTLSASGFLTIFTETIPAGLLSELSAGLGVSESAAGQLVTLYALGSGMAAIPLVSATRSMSRKRVLVMAVMTLGVFNFITAIAPWYPVILAARLVAGAAAALVWGVLAAMVSLSPSALHRAFTQDVGMSPFTWLGRVRTAEMARLLPETDGSVETIGRQVGWKNRGHATRQFKARIGMTPSQYRVAVRRTRETVCRLCGETLSTFGGDECAG